MQAKTPGPESTGKSTARLPGRPTAAREYASQAAIERALKAAGKAGLKPAGFRVEPGGGIVIFEAAAAPLTDEKEKWLAT